MDAPPATPVCFATALRVWARIGWLGFGGPAGQIALMHRELVERRGWIDEGRFLHALNFCMLLPGPEAQQLATYVGWLLHGTRGGITAGVLFVLPGVLVLGLLSALYVAWGQVPWIGAAFFGLKAAVVALVVQALMRIGKRALTTRLQWAVAAASFVAIAGFAVPFPWILLGAATLGLAGRGARAGAHGAGAAGEAPLHASDAPHLRPSRARTLRVAAVALGLWALPVVAVSLWLGADHVLAREGRFFSQTAVVTFGGAYAVLAYVAQRAVEDFGWLRPGEMVDGLALAETTPGPLIMVLQFVGFTAAYRHPGGLDPWLAAVLGALVTTWVTFVPSFLFVLVGAPYAESLRRNARVQAALSMVTAAVVGVVLNLSVWFAMHALFGAMSHAVIGRFDMQLPALASWRPLAVAIAVVSFVLLTRTRVGLLAVLALAALAGVVAGELA